MIGPKHLWSGDWERESAENASDLAEQPAPEAPLVANDEPETRRRFSVKQLAVGIVGLLVVAAVAVALVLSLGGSSSTKPASHPRTHPSGPAGQGLPGSSGGVTPANSNPAPVISGPSAEWLGMQIVTSPAGAAIDTVRAGSAGDQAGFEPGDVITAIGDQQVNTVRQLGTAAAKFPLGRRVTVTISRGSSTLTEAVTLKVRPTIRP
jgi:S1-C subfamily serine protease